MRIGIDGRFWNETGVGRYTRNLVEQLQVLDQTNEYVLFVRSKDYQRIKNQELRIKGDKWKLVEADVRWHSVEEQIKLPGILEKEQLDLMHFPYFSVPIFYHKPFIVTIHDLILNHFPTGKASTLPYPLYQAKRLGYSFVLSHAVKNAKKLIVPLHSVKDDVVKTLGVPKEKIVVTYEGVDAMIQGLGSRGKGLEKNKKTRPYNLAPNPYFLYVGNAYPHKNLELLVEAFRNVKRDESEDVKLVLVGKDDFFYKRLKEKVKELGLEDSILFLQNINDEELGNLYHQATALVLPSFMEGFGLPALEAMSTHCLVLASDIPAFREVCRDAAVYFNPKDVKDLAAKMEQVLEQRKQFNSVVAKGEKRAKEFSWKTMAEETLAVYNALKTSP